jgi:hypothetical protein
MTIPATSPSAADGAHVTRLMTTFSFSLATQGSSVYHTINYISYIIYVIVRSVALDARAARRAEGKGGMLENTTRVLLILSQALLDRARVLAGKTTTVLKRPVSLQIVLRALLEVGLKPENRLALVASVESQAKAIHQRRRARGRAGSGGTRPGRVRPGAGPRG